MGCELLVLAEAGELRGRDGLTDAYRDACADLVAELRRQEQCPQPRMDQPRELEERAVGTGEVHGHNARARATHESRGRRAPGTICHREGAQVEARHFAGREDEQRAARCEPAERHPQRSAVGAARAHAAEGIDRDDERADALEGSELRVGEDAQITPPPANCRDGGETVESAEGVIGDDHGGAGRGNVLLRSRRQLDRHFERFERTGRDGDGVREIPRLLAQACEPRESRGGECREPQPVRWAPLPGGSMPWCARAPRPLLGVIGHQGLARRCQLRRRDFPREANGPT